LPSKKRKSNKLRFPGGGDAGEKSFTQTNIGEVNRNNKERGNTENTKRGENKFTFQL